MDTEARRIGTELAREDYRDEIFRLCFRRLRLPEEDKMTKRFPDAACVVKVGGGRGFIVEQKIQIPPLPEHKLVNDLPARILRPRRWLSAEK
jgi:hypothetical protein